jgi:SAM-dependent methyltransferase
MSTEKPERITWAVEVLSVQPKEKILEIGCANGHAIELICKQLTTGKIVGIDRSARAIRTAEANNQPCVDSGKAQFFNAALAGIHLNEMFDKIFAININVFWTGPKQEIVILHGLMNKRSRLYLFYDPPSSDQLEKVTENCTKYLEAEKFEIIEVLRKRLTSNYSVCIMAKKKNA